MASPLTTLLNLSITALFIFSLSIPLPTPSVFAAGGGGGSLQEKTVLGSKPPQCIGKCLNCRPCSATLVVPEHRERKGFEPLTRREKDDSYYLLHWKCRCGNKLYQP
ncbi:EPIDERMAL PATTERNING FACTOR-like protein 8 [Momordica charantia]|uniref:Epidermal patterning factor-like protein n=1 Tax=Momordica charantia TaxID=3673 RepID=A0A6J1DJG7_MOMCH|nr:EPIDERMAL PATTERNING FACTOR-like protein 8 [Momordica charantia]